MTFQHLLEVRDKAHSLIHSMLTVRINNIWIYKIKLYQAMTKPKKDRGWWTTQRTLLMENSKLEKRGATIEKRCKIKIHVPFASQIEWSFFFGSRFDFNLSCFGAGNGDPQFRDWNIFLRQYDDLVCDISRAGRCQSQLIYIDPQ